MGVVLNRTDLYTTNELGGGCGWHWCKGATGISSASILRIYEKTRQLLIMRLIEHIHPPLEMATNA